MHFHQGSKSPCELCTTAPSIWYVYLNKYQLSALITQFLFALCTDNHWTPSPTPLSTSGALSTLSNCRSLCLVCVSNSHHVQWVAVCTYTTGLTLKSYILWCFASSQKDLLSSLPLNLWFDTLLHVPRLLNVQGTWNDGPQQCMQVGRNSVKEIAYDHNWVESCRLLTSP